MSRWLLPLCCILPLSAQSQRAYFFRLDNGAQIGYQIWSGAESQPGQKWVSQADGGGNVIRRTLFNQNGSPWLGFEIHVEREGDSDFQISFAPTPGFPYFAQNPLPRRLHEGDRVMMDVLEQPGTGKKVFDMFQLYLKLSDTAGAFLPLPVDSIPSMIPPGTPLRLSHPGLRMDGLQLTALQGNSQATGTPVSIDVPRVGRFSFSSTQLPGYRLEAVAENSKIEVAGTDHYVVTCVSPIVDKPGSWFLWVRFDQAVNAAPMTASADGPPPLEVIATPAGAGPDGLRPGLLLSVKNISPKNVVAYAIQTIYTNPTTGKGMGGAGHIAFRHRPDDYLRPGQVDSNTKPASFPVDPSGVTPQYAISVDLVVFDDGSRWGPATSRGGAQLLKQVQAAGLAKE